MNRLVVGTDGSEGANDAVALAAAQAATLGADLDVVFVGVMPAVYGAPMEVVPQGGKEYLERTAGPVREWAAEICSDAGVDANWVQELSELPIADKLLQTARDRNADLIVVGQRGLGAAGRFFLGSVSNKLAHIADLPVLVTARHESFEREIDAVAIGTDASDDAVAAAEIGLAVASANNARVALVHVEEPPPLGFYSLFPIPDKVRELTEKNKELAFEAVRPVVADADIAVDEVVLEGHASDAMLEYADRSAVDLIVVGHHGQSEMRRFLMGSVASKVLHNARIHVLIGPRRPE